MTTPSTRRWRNDPRLRFALQYRRQIQRTRLQGTLELALLDPIQQRWLRIQQTQRLLAASQDRHWRVATRHLRSRLQDQLDDLRSAIFGIQHLVPPMPKTSEGPLPSLAMLHAELRALSAEFDAVEVLPDRVSVHTPPITLREIPLGRFRITLLLAAFSCSQPVNAITTTALDPNPAAVEAATVHPHVRLDAPCLGAAADPLARALVDGRLLDGFLLINQVLQTYSDHSAYVALEDWNDQPCDQCGCSMPSERLTTCRVCEHALCERCVRSCDRCGSDLCRNCGVVAGDPSLCPACHDTYTPEEEETPDESDDERPVRPPVGTPII